MKLKQLIIRKGWLLAVPLFFSTMSLAQSTRFSEFYDIDNGLGILESVVELDDGDLVVVGNNLNSEFGWRDGFHAVVDEVGNTLNEVAISSSLGEINGQTVIRSNYSNGIYMAGYFCDYSVESPTYCDYYLSKLDESGDTLFMNVFPRPDTCDILYDLVETGPNRFLMIGQTCNDTTSDNRDLLFLTVDTLGNELNRVVWGGGGTDYIHSGTVINELGEVLMTGYTRSFGGVDNDTWLVKTDSVGNVLWQRTYNHLSPGGGDGGSEVLVLTDGNFAIVGGSNNNFTGNSDGYILKFNPDGDVIWTKKYVASSGTQSLWGGIALSDGSILSCGQTTNTIDDSQAGWLIKTDTEGDTLWTKTYNPSDLTDRLLNMIVLDNGDIVMVGSGRPEGQTNQDGWILRVDSLGCLMEGCSTVGINEELGINNDELRLYPNPTTDVLYITLADFSARSLVEMTVVVYDPLGKEVYRFNPTSERQSLDVSNWERGVYYCSLYGNKQLLQTEKLILMR